MKLFGLIGYPLTHSFSNKYFTEKFEQLGLKDHRHLVFPIESMDKFPALIEQYPELAGLNVTIPYKESVIPFLDGLDEIARGAGAVNTIKITHHAGGKPLLAGYNTDVFGFRQAIRPFLASQHSRALILGTGGAAKAVAYALRETGIDFFFVTRDKRSSRLQGAKMLEYTELNKNVMDAFKFIVNTTPIGMFPNVDAAPLIPYEYLTPEHFCFDLIYNPAETLFLKKARQQNALAENGYTMLIRQAEKSWEIWNG